MNIFEVDAKAIRAARAKEVRFDAERMHVDLTDGRTISVPLIWYPRLWYATPQQREHWELLGDGDAITWEEADEDLSVRSLLLGNRAPQEVPPFRSLEITSQELRLPEQQEISAGTSRSAQRRSRTATPPNTRG